MLETIPSMMNSLRMVWIISRHYNKDHRMFGMMQLIAGQISQLLLLSIQLLVERPVVILIDFELFRNVRS